AEGDEDLLPADHPVAAVTLRSRLEAAGVGACAGLGQRVATERLSGREPGEKTLLLLLGAPAGDALAVEPVRDGDDAADVRVGAADLLDDECVRDHLESHAAVGLG